MADNLIFRIGFDLESGVQDAIRKGDVALRRIEAAMNRKPIVLKAEVDTNKFQMFSRQFSSSIDGISAKLAQAQRIWNSMSFDVKFDADGNLSRRAQIVFDAFQQLTQASATMGQRLGEVNRNLAKSEQDTARAITAEYDKRQRQVNEQIRLKERQATAEERVRQGQLKGVNAGYVDTQRQVEAVRNLRLQYEAILPMLNAMAQRRYDIKVGIDKQFEADLQRINAEIARLRQSNLQLGAKGDTNAIQANLQAIRQLEAELQRISQQKIDLLNTNKINADISRLRTEISSVFGELQSAERRLASDNSLNAALDAQSQKVLKLHADIQKLDQQFAQLNATGKAYNQDGSFTSQANTLLQQRIALTKQLEQEAITGQQAQIKLEQQLREEKRQTEQAAKNAAKEAERQAKAEAAARKQAQDAANAENKARQEAYNARRRQGQETQQILNKEAKSIADITAKLQIQQQRLQSANIGSAKFNKIAEEVKRLTADLEKANQKMRELTGQTQSGAARQSAAVRQVNQEFKNQETYVSRLLKRMAVYASFSYASNFLTSVREVTAQFELQRISLGAIIQDQARANQLFEEIKTFALKSPVKILDLTKYTKQLAAYKFETEELFDWTKRLTDISVGLGVSMDRIVLMAGQIRATGHLRASEVRQATEAGIPLVEELAAKLSKMNGEIVTSAEVMDLISKRAISWDLVKEVFTDMTSAGGIFYNMQEKQGNTLYGMWQKLGDAAAVMYDQIGNTSSVNEGMKMAIQSLRYLMLHWKQVGIVVGGVSVYILANTIATKNNAIATATATTANKLHIASLQQKLGALRLEQMNLKSTSILQRLHTAATISATKAQIGAATSTNVFSKALYGLKAALLSNPLTALTVALTTIIALLMQSESELDKLNSKLQDIDRDYDASGKKSVDRFKELVKAVEENVDGSKAQKEALDELDRTYGKILGSEALELDNLKALGGQYGELINLIEAYNAKKRGEERKTAIESTSATIKDEAKDDLMDYLNQAGMSKEKQIEFIARLNEKLIEYAGQADAAIKATDDTFKEFAYDISQLDAAVNTLNVLDPDKLFDAWGVGFREIGGWFGGKGMSYLYDYANALQKERELLEENEIATRDAVRGLDEYAEGIDNVGKALKNLDWSSQETLYNSLQEFNAQHPENTISIPIDLSFDPAKAETEYDKMLETSNMQIHAIFANLQNIASQEGVAIPEEFYKQAKSVVDGNKDFSFIDFDSLAKLFTTDKAKNAVKESRQLYEAIAPSDDTIRMFNRKFMTLADNMNVSLDKMQKYLMKSGDNLGEHRKKLADEVTNLLKEIARLEWTKKALTLFGLPADAVEKEIQESKQTLKLLQSMISTVPDIEGIGKKKKGSKGSKGSKSDPRLQNLKEEISLLQKLYAEYKKLEKQEGAARAAEDMRKLAGKTIDMFKTKYKIDLPTNADSLASSLEILYKKMEALGTKAFPTLPKDLAELRWTIENVKIEDLQKNIEAELKRLADRISRTKTAKEFYDKVLGMTGDIQLSANLAVSVYGQNGQDLQDAIREQIRTAFETDPEKKVTIDLSEAIDPDTGAINYNKLAELEEKYKDVLISSRADLRKKLIDEGRKTSEAQVQQWLKDLEKAKDFAQQRIDLATYTANQIAAINARTDLPQADKDKLTKGYQDREAKLLAKLQYDEFKNSEMYIHIFEDLDHASTTALKNMRDRLVALKGQWQNLDPTQVKELTKAIADLDEQIAGRSPFKSIIDGFKGLADARPQKVIDAEMIAATDKLAKREEALAAATKKLTEAQTAQVNAQAEVAQARQNLEDARAASGGKETAEVKAAREVLDIKTAIFNFIKAASKDSIATAKTEVDKAAEEYEEQKKVIDALVAEGKIREANIKKIELANQKIDEYQQQINEALDGVRKMMEAFGASEEDMQFFDDVVGALNEIVDAGQQAAMSVASFMNGNILGGITSGISAIGGLVSGFTNLFSAGKVRKANKEIKRQAELLEQLEYTYGQLEASADKLFGRDYLNNYNQQLKVLQAQQKAYLKQAEAERSKGKKADKEKIKEYENQARDTANAIKEMQDDLAAQIVGTDVASAARDFANAWLDAYLSFGSTTDAIKEKFDDMIKNMIVNMVLAQVVKRALQPIFDMIDELAKDGELSAKDIAKVFAMVPQSMEDINNGLSVGMEALRAAGVDISKLREGSSEFSGIAKNIAGATSEEINTAAAIGNTIMYHTSHLPIISQNVAAMYQLMLQGKSSALPDTGATGWTDWQQQAMDNYNAIARNTADTVVRCERAAVACEAMAEKMGRIIVAKGGKFAVNTTYV